MQIQADVFGYSYFRINWLCQDRTVITFDEINVQETMKQESCQLKSTFEGWWAGKSGQTHQGQPKAIKDKDGVSQNNPKILQASYVEVP